MRQFIIFLSLFILADIPAAKAAPNAEQTTLMMFFGSLVASEIYDKMCNKPPILTSNAKNQTNVFWAGNSQMLNARILNILQVYMPGISSTEAVGRLNSTRSKLIASVDISLKEKGCNSGEAKSMAAALKNYTETSPEIMYQTIDNAIKEAGGTPTPLPAAASKK